MVYYTPTFVSRWNMPITKIKEQISFANTVFRDSEIPVKLSLFCTEELPDFEDFREDTAVSRLRQFQYTKANLFNTADIAILMTGTPICKDSVLVCWWHCWCFVGFAEVGPHISHNTFPIAWVYPEDDFSFVHEVGHLFGCRHNREEFQKKFPPWETNFGYLIKGSNMITVMAYSNNEDSVRIGRFSSCDQKYQGFSLGDLNNDNRMQIIKTRFALPRLGDESGNCTKAHHHQKELETTALVVGEMVWTSCNSFKLFAIIAGFHTIFSLQKQG